MPKKLLEDIKPLSRPGHGTSIPVRTVTETARSAPKAPPVPTHVPFHPHEPKQTSKKALWYLAIIAVIAFAFSLSFLFESATVTITPKSTPVVFDSGDTFVGYKDSTASDTIAYTQMTLSADQSITIPATETKVLSESASGTVVLYNTYTTTPYKLAVNTRLETPEGKIYRIPNAVSIPGYKKSGTTVIPGSVEVKAVASEPGEAGNTERSDFTLPGLKGTAQYSKIYARSKSAFAGGVTGTMYVVPAEAADAAFSTLEEKLKASLVSKAKVQVPDGYIFYEGATVFTPGAAVDAPYSKEQEVPIALAGTLTAYLIKEDTLVSAMAKKFISQYAGEKVLIPNLRELSLVMSEGAKPEINGILPFSFNGETPIVWDIDTPAVAEVLAGNKKSDFDTLLGDIVGIDSAITVIKPFWKQSFPKESKRITVSVETVK